MQSFIRYNREIELSFSQVNTLFRLYHHGPNTVNDLAEHLGITMAAVSQLLNQLIEAGFILRTTSDADRRVKLITLTEKGTLAVRKSINARHAWVEDLANSFTPSEKDQFLPFVKVMNERTQALFIKSDPKCRGGENKFHNRNSAS